VAPFYFQIMLRMLKRELKLQYVLFDQPYAWRCTLCTKLFVVNSASQVSPDDLENIWKEFRAHNCWCMLSESTLS
jgi:hypothetical protein